MPISAPRHRRRLPIALRSPGWWLPLLLISCSGKGPARPAPLPPPRPEPAATTSPTDPTAAPEPVEIRFLEPAGGSGEHLLTMPRDRDDTPRRWQLITDPDRLRNLRAMADNEAARFALALYREAWQLAPPPGFDQPIFFIALEPKGNYGRVGFVLLDQAGEHPYPHMPYLILAEDADSFRTTLLHEGGHVLHGLLVGDRDPNAVDPAEAGRDATPIPHSTAAITDRRTAFNEGFAIHLETVAAHCGSDPEARRFYQRRQRGARGFGNLFYTPIKDLLSYSQSFARYAQVRDGAYAFEPAPATADYLRVQLDPARDLRELRNPNALVASEGVVASVLFHFVTAGDCTSLSDLVPRYRPLLAAMKTAERTAGPLDPVPLVEVIAALAAAAPPAGADAIDAFLDITHGVTVDADAAEQWRRLFDAAIHLDMVTIKLLQGQLETRRAGWRERAIADPGTLVDRIGPVVMVEVPGTEVGLTMFGKLSPLAFDLNAAGPPMLRLVPGLTEAQLAAITAARAERPFADLADFRSRLAKARIPARALAAVAAP